jgi:hypothetical protein
VLDSIPVAFEKRPTETDANSSFAAKCGVSVREKRENYSEEGWARGAFFSGEVSSQYSNFARCRFFGRRAFALMVAHFALPLDRQ